MIIGFESALGYWRTLGPLWLRDYEKRRTATRRARRSLVEEMRPQLGEGNRRPAGTGLPVHVLIADESNRVRTKNIVTHICPAIPDACVVDAGEGFYVSTPEFCFLQLAQRLSLIKLVELGFELCGMYSAVANQDAMSRAKSLTSQAKLQAFIEANGGFPGVRKARRALRYVQNDSASPMETILTLILCLPYKLGGYGLPCPQLNYRIDVPLSLRKKADRSYCKGDLCWPEFNLCVEYDSELHHSAADQRHSDARRRSTLIMLDYTVISVTPDQLFDSGACNRLAHQIAELTGKRLRYEDPVFTHTHLSLRKELFST